MVGWENEIDCRVPPLQLPGNVYEWQAAPYPFFHQDAPHDRALQRKHVLWWAERASNLHRGMTQTRCCAYPAWTQIPTRRESVVTLGLSAVPALQRLESDGLLHQWLGRLPWLFKVCIISFPRYFILARRRIQRFVSNPSCCCVLPRVCPTMADKKPALGETEATLVTAVG